MAVRAQTGAPIPDPTSLEVPGAAAASANANPPPVAPAQVPMPALSIAAPVRPDVSLLPALSTPASPWGSSVLGALFVLGSLGGLMLYQCGLTRAKNCAHTSTMMIFGVVFALAGYWVGGFAVQSGGTGETQAALSQSVGDAAKNALDQELGISIAGHHWGVMGSSGFFLVSDPAARAGVAALFLGQAVFVAFMVASALGAALERGRLLAMAVVSFVAGAIIYPLWANWVWGGGWLAQLGHAAGLGHGVVDLAGAGVVHLTAGTLGLVIAIALGPRHGRFTRNRATGVPGHNVPFTILGTLILLVAWTAVNAFANGGSPRLMDETADSAAAVAAANVLLGATGGTLGAIFFGAWRRRRATPLRLCRGLLGGVVSLCGGSMFFDPWAAFCTGVGAALAVEGLAAMLESRDIDDPVGGIAIHGAGGAWGLIAVGFFANGSMGRGMNGVAEPVRGLFFGGGWHQLAAQAIGCVAGFGTVFLLSYGCLHLVQKIVGDRVRVADEIQGLDWPQVGALGYQPDVESEYPDDAS